MIAGLDILNLHAQGGMAEVYRARGLGADGTEYFYAVKRILPEFTRDPEIKRMFIEESRVAACLVHPNVVRVYDLAQSDGDDLYIVMEFLEGKDLSEAIEEADKKRRPLPIWFAIQIAREVLHALHYVTTDARDREGRALNLIHRDISPHNIFVCFDGQVKLTDFGVAKVSESNVKTQIGVTKGKLGYMSPEQLMGAPLDPRSDLYNVGILLYETIVGKQLFNGATTAEFLQAMVRGTVPPIAPEIGMPPELEALIRRALDRDTKRRPPTAAEFERELGAIASRYNLTAQSAHISHHLKELYGKLETPQWKKPATAPQKLKSMMIAAVPAQQAGSGALASPAFAQPASPSGPGSSGGAAFQLAATVQDRAPSSADARRTPASRGAYDAPGDEAPLTQPLPRLATRPPSSAGGNPYARPSTVARGNARALEIPPSTPRPPSQPAAPHASASSQGSAASRVPPQEPRPAVSAPRMNPDDAATDAGNETRIEVNPLLVQQAQANRPAPATSSLVGARSKKVVPLDDAGRKR